jgi:predicted metal-dependent enzyme (double-stranded beta helix superfamily)
MSIHEIRSGQIVTTIADIKAILNSGTDIEHLEKAKVKLMDLATRGDLFPHVDFPHSETGQLNRNYRLYEDDSGEFALYLAIVSKGFINGPHDHGNSWALIAAIEGQERQHLYRRIDDGKTTGAAQLEYAGEFMVEQHSALSMPVGGIHSIEGISEEPSRNLHLYGYGYEIQKDRKEFNLDLGTYAHSYNEAGVLEDFPLHLAAIQN